MRDKSGEEHRLSRFWAQWDTARPESFTIVRFLFPSAEIVLDCERLVFAAVLYELKTQQTVTKLTS